MKKLLLFLAILLLSVNTFAQSTPVGEFRVANATTAFGINLPVGTKVYNVADQKYWVATAPITDVSTLTTASASFKQLNPAETDPTVKAVNGIVKSNGSTISAAVAGTDFVAPNGVITGATKTKITYDAKGLVTSGADATTADITASANKNYVTDAQVTLLGNTSNTNSGDETAASIKTKLGIVTLSGSNTGDQDLSGLKLKNDSTGNDGFTSRKTFTSYLNTKVDKTSLGANNGVATLDASGHVPISQMDASLLGSVIYQGTYDAGTNTPALPAAAGNKGKYYTVSAPGTQQSLTLGIGDWIVSNGTIWQQVDNNNKVTSVNGAVGAVTLTTANIADATDKRYVTDAQRTVLTNTSGTNSGDNAVNTLYSGLVTNATHTGDATGSTALTVKGINGTLMSGLATGIVKNTTATGVPSIAVAGTDYVAPGAVTYVGTTSIANNRTSGAQTLNGVSIDGNAATVTTNANLTGMVTSLGNATTVVTNANLTGDVTSIGNATTVTKLQGVAVDAAAVTGGDFLRHDGTSWKHTTIASGDLPATIGANTTGTASNVTGTVAVANGGTGVATITSGNYLIGAGTSAVTSKTPAQVLADIAAVPTSRTVNAKALSADVVLNPDDLNDATATHKFVAAADITNWNGKITIKTESFSEATSGINGQVNTLSNTPKASTAVLVQLNGVALKASQYTVATNTVQISIPVYQYDAVTVTYGY